GAGDIQAHARIMVDQGVPVGEADEAVERVEHGRHRAIRLDGVRDGALGGQEQADHHEQGQDDQQGNQPLDKSRHSESLQGRPRAGPMGARPQEAGRITGRAGARQGASRRLARAGNGGGRRRAGRPARPAQTSFSSKAFSTARVRSRTPSLDRMLETWFLTVPSATPRELAISLLEKPPAIRRRISVSRSVSGSGCSRLTNSFCRPSRPESRRWVTAGCTSEPPAATVWMALTSWSRDTSLSR